MTNAAKLILCSEPNPTRSDRMAEAIARAHGVSWDDVSFLMMLAADDSDDASIGTDIRDFDEKGLGWVIWLSHRALVSLEDSMGILRVRISPKGCRVVLDARRAIVAGK